MDWVCVSINAIFCYQEHIDLFREIRSENTHCFNFLFNSAFLDIKKFLIKLAETKNKTVDFDLAHRILIDLVRVN